MGGWTEHISYISVRNPMYTTFVPKFQTFVHNGTNPSHKNVNGRRSDMQRYNLHEELGNGSFGTVYRATLKENSNQEFAIKKLKDKFEDLNEVMAYREYQAIVALSEGCDNLCHISDVLREADGSLYFVCEYMPDGTLNDFIRSFHNRGMKIEESLILSILKQVLSGLAYIHSKGYMHRDIKPENLLMRGTHCKVTDFSLARSVSIFDCTKKQMTTYVSTRWYRAPEILLSATTYSTAVDIFAVGCIMAELYELRPLLPGTGEVDQLQIVLQLLGPLNVETWVEGVNLAIRRGIYHLSPDFEPPVRQRLHQQIPSASPNVLLLLETLLKLNPNDRYSANEAQYHLENLYLNVTKVCLPSTPSNYSVMSQNDYDIDVPSVSISPQDYDNFGDSSYGRPFNSPNDHPEAAPPPPLACDYPGSLSRNRSRDWGYAPASAFYVDYT